MQSLRAAGWFLLIIAVVIASNHTGSSAQAVRTKFVLITMTFAVGLTLVLWGRAWLTRIVAAIVIVALIASIGGAEALILAGAVIGTIVLIGGSLERLVSGRWRPFR